jgi:hypothetical protein
MSETVPDLSSRLREAAEMTEEEVKQLQREMNRFTRRFLRKMAPIRVDGVRGYATDRRIVTCKYHLGYTGDAQRSASLPPKFREELDRPKSDELLPAAAVQRGEERRREHRARSRQAPPPGVTTFDGRQVASWMKPYLDFARKNGWKGTLASGFRDPVHSEEICKRMCGHPTCPGRCAGRTSNHSGSAKPKGAVDVSDFARFGQLMQRCPLTPRIHNALPQDPVHFSATGH